MQINLPFLNKRIFCASLVFHLFVGLPSSLSLTPLEFCEILWRCFFNQDQMTYDVAHAFMFIG